MNAAGFYRRAAGRHQLAVERALGVPSRVELADRDLEAILAAWNEPGPVPAYHEQHKAWVRRYWPTLAHALDAATLRGAR